MKDRIAHIMRAQNLKASDLAELLGIQPSGISHILSGRNQPSLDFVKKIKETFPEYNLDWIIFGKGPMTTSEPFKEKPVLLSNESEISTDSESAPSLFTPTADISVDAPVTPKPDTTPNLSDSGIQSVIILYNDGSFASFNPR